jgi:uncharacterized protein YfaS (alpha-2-macroglobulin family)
MSRLDVGDMVRLQVAFKDFDGMPRDPATVTLRIRKPSGMVVSVSDIQHPTPGSGVYYADILLDEAGVWRYEWSSTGNPTAVEGGDFIVYPRPIS